ncbi:MAG: hypothetical protein IJD48_03875 [Clostridia bacterium]|nr:hypothetical protein [Clostridia bacterium]
MGGFKIIKKGYSQLEVDNYIERLKADYESRLAEQKDRIFYLKDQLDKITSSSDNELVRSLVSAVEKAKLIQNSSRNIYELETKKLSLLYSKMENLLKDENRQNDKSVKQELLFLIQDCRKSLQNNISLQQAQLEESSLGDPVKRLLSKMIGFNKFAPEVHEENSKQVVAEPKLPQQSQSVQKVQIVAQKPSQPAPKPSSNLSKPAQTQTKQTVQIKRQEVKQNIANGDFKRFLKEDSHTNGANFENIMFSNSTTKPNNAYFSGANYGDYTPNETGFDLKAAVNPKEDLDEIMKAFDFFNDDKKKK